jgi:hypothetical protein
MLTEFLAITNQGCIGSAPAQVGAATEVKRDRRCIADTACCTKPRCSRYGN